MSLWLRMLENFKTSQSAPRVKRGTVHRGSTPALIAQVCGARAADERRALQVLGIPCRRWLGRRGNARRMPPRGGGPTRSRAYLSTRPIVAAYLSGALTCPEGLELCGSPGPASVHRALPDSICLGSSFANIRRCHHCSSLTRTERRPGVVEAHQAEADI